MPFLTLDAGNSALKGGLFDGPDLRDTFRIDTTAPGWEADLAAQLGDVTPSRVGLASVVPATTGRLRAHFAGGPSLLVIGPELRLPFVLAYETPATLGVDRLAASAAAWTRFGQAAGTTPRPVVALDAGTAVTYDVVDAEGVFRGGPIGPGPVLLRRALHQGTAQLPEVPLSLPEEVIGRSTQEALQSGVMYGFLDAVGGMLTRIEARLGARPVVIATGGWGPLLHQHLAAIDHVAPHLVLEGIRDLMAANPDG